MNRLSLQLNDREKKISYNECTFKCYTYAGSQQARMARVYPCVDMVIIYQRVLLLIVLRSAFLRAYQYLRMPSIENSSNI